MPTFSYDETEPTNRDKVRGRIGDVTETDPKYWLSNESITAILTQTGNVLSAAIECCNRILAIVARRVDRQGAGISTSRAQLTEHYRDLRDRLIVEQAAGGLITGTAGGLSNATADTYESETDFRLPYFGDDPRYQPTGGDED